MSLSSIPQRLPIKIIACQIAIPARTAKSIDVNVIKSKPFKFNSVILSLTVLILYHIITLLSSKKLHNSFL